MLIGVAGIPTQHFNRFQQLSGKLAGAGHRVFGVPSVVQDRSCRPTAEDAHRLIEAALALVARTPSAATSGFGVICLAHEWIDLTSFQQCFYPACLVQRARLNHPVVVGGRAGEIFINETLEEVRRAIIPLIRATTAVNTEAEARLKRSPMLLPMRNFASARLQPSVGQLFQSLLGAPKPHQLIEEACRHIEEVHPFVPKGELKGFTDDSNVTFRSPGRDLHARLWENAGKNHNVGCTLNGYFRLGGSLRQGFHFDCTRSARLEGVFQDCHGAAAAYRGDPHLNIAPNDFVRA